MWGPRWRVKGWQGFDVVGRVGVWLPAWPELAGCQAPCQGPQPYIRLYGVGKSYLRITCCRALKSLQGH